jgi:2-aminoadipate transaminase
MLRASTPLAAEDVDGRDKPGPEWSTDKSYGRSRTRLCFANASHEAIRAGIAALAEVCRREFGVPARIANVERVRA